MVSFKDYLKKSGRLTWKYSWGNDSYERGRWLEFSYRDDEELWDAKLLQVEENAKKLPPKLIKSFTMIVRQAIREEGERRLARENLVRKRREAYEMQIAQYPSAVFDCACMDLKVLKRKSRSLEDLNEELEDGFSVSLLKHIARKGLNEVEVYKKAGVDRKLFSKIKKNPDYQPKKSTALAFAFALGLNLDETKDFIGRAGYALTRSRVADVIILEFLNANDHDLDKLNAVLYEFHQPLIGF